MRKKWIVFAPLAIVGLLLFITLGGFIVQLLWNWLMPLLFGWHAVTFWQALGLLLLCRILFGRFGGHRVGRDYARRRIVDRMTERFDRMTPEEREQFRQRVRDRWGVPSPGESKS